MAGTTSTSTDSNKRPRRISPRLEAARLAKEPPPPALFDALNDALLLEVLSSLTVRDLGRLARTSKLFSERRVRTIRWFDDDAEDKREIDSTSMAGDAASSADGSSELSLVEEAARLSVQSHANDGRDWARRPSSSSSCRRWLRSLADVEALIRPLRFTLAGQDHILGQMCGLQLPGHPAGTVAWNKNATSLTAVCGDAVMWSGVHYAEFTLLEFSCNMSKVGVIGADFDLKHRNAVMLDLFQNRLYRVRDSYNIYSHWVGMPPSHTFQPTSVIGLLLDIDAGTLAVYHNGERLGVMAQRGVKTVARPIPSWLSPLVNNNDDILKPPLQWATVLCQDGSIRVERHDPPIETPPADQLASERKMAQDLFESQHKEIQDDGSFREAAP